MINRRAALVVVIFALGGITAAGATTVSATYTGTIYDGGDYGLFTVGTNNLDGLPFTAVFTFDVTNWVYTDVNHSSGAAGGTEYGSPNSASVSLTINGVDANLDEPYFANYEGGIETGQYSESRYSFESAVVPGSLYNGVAAIVSSPDPNGLPEDLLTPFSYTVPDGGAGAGSFQFYDANSPHYELAYGELIPTSETVSVSAVPLPSSLLLLASALGFGALCGYVRRRSPHSWGIHCRYMTVLAINPPAPATGNCDRPSPPCSGSSRVSLGNYPAARICSVNQAADARDSSASHCRKRRTCGRASASARNRA